MAKNDWLAALNSNKPDWDTLKALSGVWDTCAVAQFVKRAQKDRYGAPTDPALRQLGGIFCYFVHERDAGRCLRIVEQIKANERRSK